METTAGSAAAGTTGYVAVEAVRGRSTVTRCFAKYPLKFIVPGKAGSSRIDAVWIYALTYGGGILSGDCVRCGMSVGNGCTAVFTTQASTKQDTLRSKCLELPPTPICFLLIGLQVGDMRVVKNGIFGFTRASIMSLWKAINLFFSIRPKLKHVRDQIQNDVKKMMSGSFHAPNPARGSYSRRQPERVPAKPSLIASCSAFGPKAMGVVVRIAASTTESVYEFLRHNLAGMEALLGAPLYC